MKFVAYKLPIDHTWKKGVLIKELNNTFLNKCPDMMILKAVNEEEVIHHLKAYLNDERGIDTDQLKSTIIPYNPSVRSGMIILESDNRMMKVVYKLERMFERHPNLLFYNVR